MLKNLDIAIFNLNRLKIYRAIIASLKQKASKGVLKNAKADEILAYLDSDLKKVKSNEEAKQFCIDVVVKFPELSDVKAKFDQEEGERLNKFFVLLIDHIMSDDNFELAAGLMSAVEELESKWDAAQYNELHEKYPELFMTCLGELMFPEPVDFSSLQ